MRAFLSFCQRYRLRWGLVPLLFCLIAWAAPLAAAPIPLRGIVEGFYGEPWQPRTRRDMIRFCARQGFNAYIYAPKNDPFLRDDWRRPYPDAKLEELAQLAMEAKTAGVRFIVAVSPGLDSRYALLRGAQDRLALREKLECLYGAGVRDFAVFFDDIEHASGRDHAALLRWLDENFVRPHGDVPPLITVGTAYARQTMEDAQGGAVTYIREFAAGLPADTLVLYTGDGIARGGLTPESLAAAGELLGRTPGLWWNYPVNDYMTTKLALGPVEKLPDGVPAAFFNPMAQAELSKIALATGAAWALDPEGYDPDTAWHEAIAGQYGPLAREMTRFAETSRRLENNWAAIGFPDAPALKDAMADFQSAWPGGQDAGANWQCLHDQLAALEKAVDTLEDDLPRPKLRECKPQLARLKALVKADLAALHLLKARRTGEEKEIRRQRKHLEKQLDWLRKNEGKARIAEDAAGCFLWEFAAGLQARDQTPRTAP